MKRFRDRYPDVHNFFACTFHQDCWNDLPDGSEPTMVAVLNDAFEQYSHSEMLELQRTFRDFLPEASNFDHETIGDILEYEFGASYYAPWDGSTYRSWLEFVDKQLAETIAERMRLV